MERTFNHIDDLIGKYLAGEATRDESLIVETWLKQSEDNRRYFDHLKTIFQRAASITDWHQFDADAAWNKVRGQLHQKQSGKTISLDRDSTGYGILWKIAAGIVIILGSVFIYRMISENTAT